MKLSLKSPSYNKKHLLAFALIFGTIGLYTLVSSFAAAPTTANLWIDTNGGSCTRSAIPSSYIDAQACGSFEAAYGAASSGDTVVIADGTYPAQFFGGGELSLIRGCNNSDVLKWNNTSFEWECAADTGAGAAWTTIDIVGTDPIADGSGDTIQFLLDGSNLTLSGTDTPESLTWGIDETVLAGAGLVKNGDALDTISANGGIAVTANDIALTITTTGTAGAVSSNSGLEILSGGLTLLKGCANNEFLKWNETTSVWACSTDSNSVETLQTAYDNDADGSDAIIALTTTDGSLIFRNPVSGGSSSAYVLTIDQLATGAVGGLSIESAGTGNLFKVRDTTATAVDVLTIADGGATTFRSQTNSAAVFQVQNAAGGGLLSVDSTNGGSITILGNNSGETGAWQTNGSSGFTAVESHCTVTANGYFYTIGGVIGGAAANTVQYAKLNANGSLGNWSTTTAINVGGAQNRSGPACAVANGYVYVIAGSSNNANSGVTSTVYYARLNRDGTVGSWAAGNSIPRARWFMTANVYNGYLYAVGGAQSGGGGSAQVYWAKLNGDGTVGQWGWSTSTDMTSPIAAGGSVVANGYLYVVDNDNALIQYSKLGTNGTPGTWATTTSLPEARDFASAVVANGYMYVIGGAQFNTSNFRATIYYAPFNADGTLGSWVTANQQMPSAKDAFGTNGVIANGYMYAIGGWAGSVQSSQYYASVSRTTIGGSLDLVGLTGENLADGGSGGSLTAGNTNVLGSLDVRDNVHLAGGASIASSLTVNGSTALRGIQGLTGFLNVQNAGGISAFNINSVNQVGAGSFENGVNAVTPEGWSAKGSGTPTVDNTEANFGSLSMKIVTTTTANDGAKFNFPLGVSTQYTLSFYGKVSSGSITDVQAGRSDDGTTATNCFGGGQTLTTTWTRFSCTFTTGDTISGTPFIYIHKNLTSAETFFIDGVQLELAASVTNYRESDIKADGQVTFKNSADSTTAFQIQNAAGTSNLFVADTTNTRIGIGTNAPLARLHISSSGTDPLFRVTDETATARDVLNIADGGAVTFRNQTDSTSAFVIQNASGSSLLTLDTTNSVLTFAGTTTSFITVTLSEAHFKVTQTTAPTIGTPTNCGTTPSAAVTTGSTDSAGSFTITAGTGSPTTCDTVITFNKAYGAAPKAVILTATTAVGSATGAREAQVSAVVLGPPSRFTIKLSTNPAASEVNSFYYWAIE